MTQGVPEILVNCLKIVDRKIPEILSNYSKTRHKVLRDSNKWFPRFFQIRDSFKLLQKQDIQRVSEIISNYILQKQNTRGPSDFFKVLQKEDPQEVPEIFSNYF